MGKDEEEAKLQTASVTFLDGTFRGCSGEVLFTMVGNGMSVEEKDHFALCFFDNQGIRHWVYNDKKILRQLKGLPWVFSFQVKFYPVSPASLMDDTARHMLYLQCREDIKTGKLSASLPTRASLAALSTEREIDGLVGGIARSIISSILPSIPSLSGELSFNRETDGTRKRTNLSLTLKVAGGGEKGQVKDDSIIVRVVESSGRRSECSMREDSHVADLMIRLAHKFELPVESFYLIKTGDRAPPHPHTLLCDREEYRICMKLRGGDTAPASGGFHVGLDPTWVLAFAWCAWSILMLIVGYGIGRRYGR